MSGRGNLGVIDCGSRSVQNIVEIAGRKAECVRVPLPEAATHDWQMHEGIIISGGPQLLSEPGVADQVLSPLAFLAAWNKPVLGICLGHQILGLLAGGKVSRGEVRRGPEGVYLRAGQFHPLLKGLAMGEKFDESHCEGVTLPPGWLLLGSSEFYEVEAMASPDGLRCGVQFHPERSGPAGERLIGNFVEMVAGWRASHSGTF